VARRYRVNPQLVAQWNGVGKTASFKPGQTIVVYVAGKAPRTNVAASKHRTRTAAAPRKGAAKRAQAPAGKVRVART